MPTPILMPALSPTMEEGTLSAWLKSEGDSVAAGDVIAEIETDKATMEVEAVDEGTLGKILIEPGTEGVKVNEPIAWLLEEGESEADIPEDASQAGSTATGEPETEADGAATENESQPSPTNGSGGEAQPAPTHAPAEEGAGQPGYGREAGAPPQAQPGAAPPSRGNGTGRIFASPLARRLAEQAGLDLSTLHGSGPHGRIIKADIEKAKTEGVPEAAPTRAASPAAAAPAPAAGGDGLSIYRTVADLGLEEGTYETVKLDGMRKTIARRMAASKREAPHFPLTVDLRIDRLLSARKEINAALAERDAGKVSVNDMILKAAALALMDVPGANASYTDEAIVRYKHADIAVAVALDEGLITPIIRKVETKGLAQIAAEAKDLSNRARNRKLMPEEYSGGTFSVSNLGMFGVREFAAVINQPHGAILAVGAGEQRPIIDNGAMVAATMMTCTLSCDHRVVDGATGARWLQAFRGYIEQPSTMLL